MHDAQLRPQQQKKISEPLADAKVARPRFIDVSTRWPVWGLGTGAW